LKGNDISSSMALYLIHHVGSLPGAKLVSSSLQFFRRASGRHFVWH
jgi:hypothetical protein